uniref:Uncharacterized protein n=1 Tax=viral metagenome TaxID=1070528 RepID=A0A6H1ZL98_9ZZZZ
MTKRNLEDILKKILTELEEVKQTVKDQNIKIEEIEKKSSYSIPSRSPSLSDMGIVPVEQELSEDTKDKIKKAVELILRYSEHVPYLQK